jgi:hypothetical protein
MGLGFGKDPSATHRCSVDRDTGIRSSNSRSSIILRGTLSFAASIGFLSFAPGHAGNAPFQPTAHRPAAGRWPALIGSTRPITGPQKQAKTIVTVQSKDVLPRVSRCVEPASAGPLGTLANRRICWPTQQNPANTPPPPGTRLQPRQFVSRWRDGEVFGLTTRLPQRSSFRSSGPFHCRCQTGKMSRGKTAGTGEARSTPRLFQRTTLPR